MRPALTQLLAVRLEKAQYEIVLQLVHLHSFHSMSSLCKKLSEVILLLAGVQQAVYTRLHHLLAAVLVIACNILKVSVDQTYISHIRSLISNAAWILVLHFLWRACF